MAKNHHHEKAILDGASLSQALEQIKITANPPKHTVVKANESEAGAASPNQPVPQRAVHFAPSAGTIPDASQSRARFDGVTGLPVPQLQQILKKLNRNRLPTHEEFKQKYQY